VATASSILRDISDTARWAAVFRARENERTDALFRDPFAARLAGPRGFEIAETLSNESHNTSWIVRTYLFDRLISKAITAGVDVVVNLGSGLDARPYRMPLPSSLRWIEMDVPEILRYKAKILENEKPNCSLERIGLDLLNRDVRCQLLAELNRQCRKALVITEGVLIYLDRAEVAALASDLAEHRHLGRWILEVVSPGVIETMRRTAGSQLHEAGAAFRFGPAEGPAFFSRYRWILQEVHSLLKTAVRLNRTPIDPKLLDHIPDWREGEDNSLPWVGVCLFHAQDPAPVSPI
jgi:methyltransferase (TIGR00027 family)